MTDDHASLLESGAVRLKRTRHGYMSYLISDRYVGRSFDRYGEFSEGEIELFRQLVRPGWLAVDGGANIGAHTLPLSALVGPTGAVIAAEPQRIIHQLLCANLALNAVTNVRAMHTALGAEPGRITIPPIDYDAEGNFGGLALGGHEKGESVAVATLDSLELPVCHFIKLDVEGMEAQVLTGAAQTIAHHRPILYVENDRKDRSAALLGTLLGMDYRLYWHLPPLFNPNNFFAEAENLFGAIVSVNVLGLPGEAKQDIKLPEIESADAGRPGGGPVKAKAAKGEDGKGGSKETETDH